jgi:hypothetical protein
MVSKELNSLEQKNKQELEKKAAELRKYIILMNCYAGSEHLNTFY